MLFFRFPITIVFTACLVLQVAGCNEPPLVDVGELAGDISEAEIEELKALQPAAIGDDLPAFEIEAWANNEFTRLFSNKLGQGQVVLLDVWDPM